MGVGVGVGKGWVVGGCVGLLYFLSSLSNLIYVSSVATLSSDVSSYINVMKNMYFITHKLSLSLVK